MAQTVFILLDVFICLPSHPSLSSSSPPSTAWSLRQYLDVTASQHADTHVDLCNLICPRSRTHTHTHALKAHTHKGMLPRVHAPGHTLTHTRKQFHLFPLFPVACDGTDTLSHLISVETIVWHLQWRWEVFQGGRLWDAIYKQKKTGEEGARSHEGWCWPNVTSELFGDFSMKRKKLRVWLEEGTVRKKRPV